MTKANEVQVGGDHYRNGQNQYQHWDYVHKAGLGYMEGQITRYVSRHRQKHGRQDLEKARHFIIKLIEQSDGRRPREVTVESMHEAGKWIATNRFQNAEANILMGITCWRVSQDLENALDNVGKLIATAYPVIYSPDEGGPTSGYVDQDRA